MPGATTAPPGIKLLAAPADFGSDGAYHSIRQRYSTDIGRCTHPITYLSISDHKIMHGSVFRFFMNA